MNIQAITPDSGAVGTPGISSITQPTPDENNADAGLFSGIVNGFQNANTALESASTAETNFANGNGGLQEMVFERARADSLLSIASAGASKATQAINTIMNMQV